jgi:hypothetical protein
MPTITRKPNPGGQPCANEEDCDHEPCCFDDKPHTKATGDDCLVHGCLMCEKDAAGVGCTEHQLGDCVVWLNKRTAALETQRDAERKRADEAVDRNVEWSRKAMQAEATAEALRGALAALWERHLWLGGMGRDLPAPPDPADEVRRLLYPPRSKAVGP